MKTEFLLDTVEKKLVKVLNRRDNSIEISVPFALIGGQVPHSILEHSENSVGHWIPIDEHSKKRYVDWEVDKPI